MSAKNTSKNIRICTAIFFNMGVETNEERFTNLFNICGKRLTYKSLIAK